MFSSIIFTLCFAYALSAGSNDPDPQPSLGLVYPIKNNDTVLNFTFVYPSDYGFDNLYVNFTIYDFVGSETLNPQIYRFQSNNFTNSNISLPWVIPPVTFVPGDYVICCFQWIETDKNDKMLADTLQCLLTRATYNGTISPIAQPMVLQNVVTNTNATITGYYPAELPYDKITITPTSNNTIKPTDINSTSSSLYTNITTFTYTNLVPSSRYTLCFQFNYTNSLINGTQGSTINCTTVIATFSGTTNSPPTNSANTPSKYVLSNLIMMMITLFIYAFI